MKTNYFSRKVKNRTTEELISIGRSKGELTERFVLAALWELETRGKLTAELQERLDNLELKNQEELEKSEYDSHFIPPDLPNQLKITAYLLYSVFILELIQMLVFSKFSTIGFNSFVLPESIITLFVALFIHQGKIWAKYAFYVVFLISTLFFFLSIQRADLIDILQEILIVVAIFFITRKESRNWYNEKTAPNSG